MKLLRVTVNTFSITALLLAGYTAQAQSKVRVGFVKDSSTQQPLANVLVTNEFTHQLTHTDDKGMFRIEATRGGAGFDGDIIFFDAQDYHFDTLRYSIMTADTVTLYLAHLPNVLAGVTVTARGLTKYQQDSIKRRMDFESIAGRKMNTVSQSNSGAGIGINLDPLLTKNGKSKKKAYKTFDEIERADYVEFRFSRDLVAGYTGLRDDRLTKFIEKYRPTYDWLRDHPTSDDVFYYINDKLKEYMKK